MCNFMIMHPITPSPFYLLSRLDVLRIKRLWTNAFVGWVITALLRPGVCGREAALGIVAGVGVLIQVIWPSSLGGGSAGHSVWLQLVSRWEWLWCHLIGPRGHTVVCPCGPGRVNKCRATEESHSLDIEPAAGSLLFAAPVRRLAAEFCLCGVWYDRVWWHLRVTFVMAAGRDTPAGDRSGVTFDVMLEVPWNAPEAYVQLHSAGVFELKDTIPDVSGLCDRRPDAAKIRVTQGRDSRSVCTLIPNPRVLDNGFHDVTIVDMEDAAEPAVSEADLSLLRRQWPVTAVQSMTWMQNELDEMRAAAKKRYRISRPGACSYCGTYIKCDMHRHVSTFHLDLGQWRCLVSWCTMWKGTPQDCMDHVRGAHNVLPDIKSASLDRFFPPWTVRRQIWADGLNKPCHSGVSTEVLLFSEIHLSLVHHYQVFQRGLPIMHSVRTTWPGCGCLYRRCRAWSSVPGLLRFWVARALRGMFAPVTWGQSLRKDTSNLWPET